MKYLRMLPVYIFLGWSVFLVLVQILYKIYKGHRFLLESTLKQLIQITDEYIYSDF